MRQTTTWIVLLRAVNVGGTGKIAMADLRATLEELGFEGARTVLQSGNVVLDAAVGDRPALEQRVQRALEASHDLRAEVIARSADEWRAVVAGNPFAEAARSDPGHLLTIVSKRAVSSEGVRALEAAIAKTGGRETAGVSDGTVYIHYPDGAGRSKVTTALIERALGTPVTARNWNTVLKLASLAAAAGD